MVWPSYWLTSLKRGELLDHTINQAFSVVVETRRATADEIVKAALLTSFARTSPDLVPDSSCVDRGHLDVAGEGVRARSRHLPGSRRPWRAWVPRRRPRQNQTSGGLHSRPEIWYALKSVKADINGIGGHDEKVDGVIGAALTDAKRKLVIGHGEVFVRQSMRRLCANLGDVGVDVARMFDDGRKAVERTGLPVSRGSVLSGGSKFLSMGSWQRRRRF